MAFKVPSRQFTIVLPGEDKDGFPLQHESVLSRIEVTEAGALIGYREYRIPYQDEPGESEYVVYAPGQWVRADRWWVDE